MAQTVMHKAILAFGVATASLSMPDNARAQSTAEFVEAFGGEWYIFEPAFHSGSSECQINLTPDMTASSRSCASPLENLATWRIDEGQIVLLDSTDQRIASLGGNQRRVTGNIDDSGRGLIIERADGDGTSAAISTALGRHKCFFLGFTRTCAPPEALIAPSPAAEDGNGDRIEILANLNVRAQPRRDAPIIGVLEVGTPVTVDYCTVASDGVWCRAIFGTKAGWMAKIALRQNEWPIVTYRTATERS